MATCWAALYFYIFAPYKTCTNIFGADLAIISMGDFMYKRVVIFFSMLMVAMGIAVYNTYKISKGEMLCDSAAKQSSYKLKVATMRGNIYDCQKRPLVGVEDETYISVTPEVDTLSVLPQILSEDERNLAFEEMKAGKPFVLKLSDEKQVIARGIKTFKVPQRYAKEQIAPHIIGYLNGDMQGVCGIEKAFNDYLNSARGSIFVKYKVDALNRRIPGEGATIENTMYKCSRGIVLTIDQKIQRMAEVAAQKYIKKGAVIVTEVPNCEIRACVSMPTFSPTNVVDVLNDEDSPLLNRALLPYNIGSVFKLVTAAAILQENKNPNAIYECTGSCEVDGHKFHCFNNKGHGPIDLEKAVAFSCNAYFIEKALEIGGEKILNLAKDLGFSKEIELAPGITSKAGVLPTLKDLEQSRALANFSFGQGKLLVTPLQVAALTNAIAAEGLYCEPRLVEGLVNEGLKYVQKAAKPKPTRVLTAECAKHLVEYMKASVEYGTSKQGKPEVGIAAAKTGTAQTGIKSGDHAVVQAWYAGIFPAEKPKYSIIVFAEDAKGGGESCGPAFKKIAEEIFVNILKDN